MLKDNKNLFSLKINCLETNANGYMFSKIYHIDKNTANIIILEDVFKKDSDYINIINKNIKEQMRQQMKNDENKIYFIDTDMSENDFKQI